MTSEVTQDDIDALWLACRVDIDIGDNPRNLRQRAQLRLQRLVSAGIVEHEIGARPLVSRKEHFADLNAKSGEGRSGAWVDAQLHDIADKIIAAVKADDDCRGRGKFEVMQILSALRARQSDEGERDQ